MKEQHSFPVRLADPSFWEEVQVPELTPAGRDLTALTRSVPRKSQALATKLQSQALWMVIVGGTGTGKSTLFNALCGQKISRTGVERPKTRGAVAFAHTGSDVHQGWPSFLGPILHSQAAGNVDGYAGDRHGLTLVSHSDDRLASLVLVDTPDLDSMAVEHQELSANVLLLADVVVFVTSQEKYADDVLYRALRSVGDAGRELYFVLNKVDPPPGEGLQAVLDDVRTALDPEGTCLVPEHCMAVPLNRTGGNLAAVPEVQGLAQALTAFYASGRGREVMRRQRRAAWDDLRREVQAVDAILEEEEAARLNWEKGLQAVFEECRTQLLQREEAGFAARHHQSVQTEIRKAFSRFDLLAGPRRALGNILRFPLTLVGITGHSRRARREDLEEAKGKASRQPIQESVDAFNALVLERLLPAAEESAAGMALRRPELALPAEQVEARFQAVQDETAAWLNERFERLAAETPKGKALGIYTTSALWGVLILSFEAAVGGGISLVEALADSAIAPFVTKGAVELFAYHEVKNITRELGARFQDGIVSILTEQYDRYAQVLRELSTGSQARKAIREWAGWPEKKALAALADAGPALCGEKGDG